MNIHEALARENARILKIMRKLEDTTAHKPGVREELLRQARIHLAAQKKMEEGHLYPLLLSSPKTFGSVARAREETGEIDSLIDRLAATDKRNPACRYLLEHLSSLFQAHASWEEHTLFRQAMQVIPMEEAELLGAAAESDRDEMLHQARQS